MMDNHHTCEPPCVILCVQGQFSKFTCGVRVKVKDWIKKLKAWCVLRVGPNSDYVLFSCWVFGNFTVETCVLVFPTL